MNYNFMTINPTNSNNLVTTIIDVTNKGCSDYIVLMKEPRIFMIAFDKASYLGNIRKSDKKIIILPFPDNVYVEQALKILSMEETSFIANILLVLPTTEKTECMAFDFITHKFVGSDAEVSQPLYLNRWNSCSENFENDANLFPHNMNNLWGKTLKVSCFTYKPYVLLDVDTAVEPFGRDGMEMRIIDEFCRWINCTVKVIREDKDQWGEIYENHTGIGVLGSVVEDRADVGITALYSWYEMWKVLDFSMPIIRSGITCLAPAPRVLVSWDLPLLPFTWYMWTAVAITIVYACVGLVIAQKCSTDRVLLTVFGIMISQSQYNAGATWRIRRVIGWLLVTGLILGSAYGAGLATTFTIPKYEPAIDTAQDIVERGVEWGATHDAWIFSLTLSPEPQVKKLVQQFKIYSFDELKKKSFTRSMAFSIEKLPAGYFAIGEYITKEAVLDMQLMLEDFYYEQCVVMLRKSSPYTKKISKLIGRLHQSGLILAWETQVALNYLDYEVQVEVKLSRFKDDVVETKPLSLKTIGGIFLLYIAGSALSTMIFIAELFINRNNSFVITDRL